MSSKSIKEFRNLSEQELDEKITGLKQQLLEFRFKAAGGRLEKPSQVKIARRNIARILTLKNELKAKAKKG